MIKGSIFAAVVLLALVAGCAESSVIPPNAPPQLSLPPLALAGDPDAQVSLGYMYQTGQFFAQSYSEAARWYRPAAAQGNSLAQFALGELYALGLGLERDYKAAAYWFRHAADNGNVSAQIQLAGLYEKGLGVARDYSAAARLYDRAVWDSRGQGAPPLAIERLAGWAFETPHLTRPPRLSPTPAPIPNQADRLVLQKPANDLPGIDPSPRTGIWLHVASFRTIGAAENQWQRFKDRHPALLNGLDIELVRTDLGTVKGVWIRVQIGPMADMTAAKKLCAALQTRKIYCATITR